jgi:hypothetical protein
MSHPAAILPNFGTTRLRAFAGCRLVWLGDRWGVKLLEQQRQVQYTALCRKPTMDLKLLWSAPIPLIECREDAGQIYKIDLEAVPSVTGVYMFMRVYGKSKCPLYIGRAGGRWGRSPRSTVRAYRRNQSRLGSNPGQSDLWSSGAGVPGQTKQFPEFRDRRNNFQMPHPSLACKKAAPGLRRSRMTAQPVRLPRVATALAPVSAA